MKSVCRLGSSQTLYEEFKVELYPKQKLRVPSIIFYNIYTNTVREAKRYRDGKNI